MDVPFLNKVPGFQSGSIFKAVIATIVYLFLGFILLIIILIPSEDSSKVDTQSQVQKQVREEQDQAPSSVHGSA